MAHRISVSRQAEADTHGVMHMEMAKVDPNTVLRPFNAHHQSKRPLECLSYLKKQCSVTVNTIKCIAFISTVYVHVLLCFVLLLVLSAHRINCTNLTATDMLLGGVHVYIHKNQ